LTFGCADGQDGNEGKKEGDNFHHGCLLVCLLTECEIGKDFDFVSRVGTKPTGGNPGTASPYHRYFLLPEL
jgi:hypothetical protein